METVSPDQSESSFYSHYFLVPKKDGGQRPILDPRHLKRALMTWPFRIITSKQILSQIYPGNWFFSLDLKAAYWLILAQSEDELLSYRSMLLNHLECLGLRVNFAKSVLSPANKFSSWEQLSTQPE